MAPAKQFVRIAPVTEQQILTYAAKAHELLLNQFSMRSNLEEVDRYYAREGDWTSDQIRSRIANRLGDKRKFQDVTVPVVMPQVRAALGYMANVFLTGYPIFGVASDPDNEAAAMQMETVIAENAVTAAWARQLLMFFNDGLKYNLHGIELEWQKRTVPTISTDVSKGPGNAAVKETIWQGNVLKRMDLYNTFFDPRVAPADIASQAEYAGYIELFSRTQMKTMINNLFGEVPPSVANRALESGPAAGGATSSGSPFSYYVPLINPYPIMFGNRNMQSFDWMAWGGLSPSGPKSGIRYSNVFEVMTLYARIIPSDFGLQVPKENTPQVWKFKIVNGKVVIFAERQSNVHDMIPIFFGQPLEDGLNYQTKSFAQNVFDMQDVASACWNGYIASKRRLVGDRVLYDPMRIREKDINSTSPVAKIPVRPSAFGKPVAEAVYQFPFRDEATQSLLDGAGRIVAFANQINQQNPAQQGQFVKGNKTKTEYDDVMGHGNAGNQMLAIATENQVFIPMKEAIKLNILQFQEETNYFNRDQKQQVAIRPTELREAAVHFKVSDGLIPEEKQLNEDEWMTAMQALMQPTVGADFDVGGVFNYIMQLRGVDLTKFRKDPVAQAADQKFNQLMSLIIEPIQKGVVPPTAEQIKMWEQLGIMLSQFKNQMAQQAQQQAQQAAQQQAGSQ